MRKRILLLAIGLSVAGLLTGCNSDDYKKAASLYEEGNYEEAITMYEELGDYKDSKDQLNASKFLQACKLQDEGNYDEAIAIYDELGDYEASVANKEKCYHGEASKLIEDKNYTDALAKLDGYTDTEEGKHLADICNVHIDGMDGLITYMQENLELNNAENYAYGVYISEEDKVHVVIYCDKDEDVLMAETRIENKDSGEPIMELNLSGKKKGNYSFERNTIKAVDAAYASSHEVVMINNYYFTGYNLRASGNIDFAKFKKGKKVKIDGFVVTKYSSDKSDDEYKDETADFLSSFVSTTLEGLQQFINEEDLRISVKELGFENYETTYAEDPYSNAVTPGDYSADTTVNGETVDISKSLDTNSDKDTSDDSTGDTSAE